MTLVTNHRQPLKDRRGGDVGPTPRTSPTGNRRRFHRGKGPTRFRMVVNGHRTHGVTSPLVEATAVCVLAQRTHRAYAGLNPAQGGRHLSNSRLRLCGLGPCGRCALQAARWSSSCLPMYRGPIGSAADDYQHGIPRGFQLRVSWTGRCRRCGRRSGCGWTAWSGELPSGRQVAQAEEQGRWQQVHEKRVGWQPAVQISRRETTLVHQGLRSKPVAYRHLEANG